MIKVKERPEVIQNKPNRDLRGSQAKGPGVRATQQTKTILTERCAICVSGIFSLYDVKVGNRWSLNTVDRRKNGLFAHGITRIGGACRDRTDDLKLAKLPLSQLS
jgi:hypothetical protein